MSRTFSRFLCVALLIAFAALSYSAACTKNSTFDETLHVPAAWASLHGDFRANPEHPPLWKYFCALPNLFRPINTGSADAAEDFKSLLVEPAFQWNWALDVLDRTPGNNADAIVNNSRFMMMLVGVALGALIIRWGWKLGGPAAAIVAGTAYCFDPNITAHASLVTNDVAFSLCVFIFIYAAWRLGTRATWPRAIVLACTCALGIVVKFSGLLLGPMLLLLLLIRAIQSESWPAMGRMLVTRWQRLKLAIAICLLTALVSYFVIWAVYLFRYSATVDCKPLAWPVLIEKIQSNEIYSRHPGLPVTPTERAHWRGSLLTRSLLFANTHHLLPEAFCFGVLHVHMGELVRASYLLGQISPTGWWYYFPLAMAFKTPTATLVAMLIAAFLICFYPRRWSLDQKRRWLAICLGVPAAFYMLFMLRANLNLGLRHIFPIYPPIYLVLGLIFGGLWNKKKQSLRIGCVVLGLLLIAESVSAWPDYIPFFNTPSGGARGGLRLLGDSNLDWGQDMKNLAKWQQSHEGKRLYLLYFGTVDPWYYGLNYFNLPGGFVLGPPTAPPTAPGIIAISATHLQGIYLDDAERRAYSWMQHAQPINVIGGSIYLFDYPYHGPMH